MASGGCSGLHTRRIHLQCCVSLSAGQRTAQAAACLALRSTRTGLKHKHVASQRRPSSCIGQTYHCKRLHNDLLWQAATSRQAEAVPNQASVWDYIIFFQVREGVAENTAQKMLDDFWSLQYLVPGGALNAFAGSLRSALLLPSSHKLTHALHLRFATCQQFEAFQQGPQLQAAKELASTDVCSDIAELAIHSVVPKELESIFRRGADWESGFDLILLLEAKEDVQAGEMEGFLDALSQISCGPGMQALQCVYAPVQLLSGPLSGDHVLFARFQDEQQLHSFLKSPPCVALQEQDARLPASSVYSYILSIGPPEANRTKAADAGGILGVSNM